MLFTRDYQNEILEAIKTDQSETWSKIINDLIKDNTATASKMFGLWNRYILQAASEEDKQDGVPILARKPVSETSVNHTLNHSFDRKIVSNKKGYLGKGIALTIEDEKANQVLQDFLKLESFNSEISELVGQACDMGKGFLLLFSNGERPQFKLCNPWETIIVRNDFGQKQLALRHWTMKYQEGDNDPEDRIYVELYTPENIFTFIQKEKGGAIYELQENPVANVFSAVTIYEFLNNPEGMGNVEIVTKLIDAYDVSMSDLSSEITQMRLAYLVQVISAEVQAMDIDEEFKKTLRETGVLLGDWRFLEKDLKADAVLKLQEVLRRNIFLLSDSYDPDDLAQGDMTAYQIKQKLKGLEDSSMVTENCFRKSILELITDLAAYWQKKGTAALDPAGVIQAYPRNLPVNEDQEIQNFVQAGGRISNETLLSRLSFMDKDKIQDEIKRIQKETEDEINGIRLPGDDGGDIR